MCHLPSFFLIIRWCYLLFLLQKSHYLWIIQVTSCGQKLGLQLRQKTSFSTFFFHLKTFKKHFRDHKWLFVVLNIYKKSISKWKINLKNQFLFSSKMKASEHLNGTPLFKKNLLTSGMTFLWPKWANWQLSLFYYFQMTLSLSLSQTKD